MSQGLLDHIGTGALFLVVLAAFAGAVEAGVRLGRVRARRSARPGDERAFAATVLGALLGLLALLLAFGFNIVEGRLAARRYLVLEEANAIGMVYLRAELLPTPHVDRVRGLLRRYTEARKVVDADSLAPALAEAVQLQDALWREAAQAARTEPSPVVALFVSSLNEVIDVHEERVAVGLYHRLPRAFLWTLLAIGALSMTAMGYQLGFHQRRAPLLSGVVVVALSVVLLLIVEMDRPWGTWFPVSHEPLADVLESMQPPDESIDRAERGIAEPGDARRAHGPAPVLR